MNRQKPPDGIEWTRIRIRLPDGRVIEFEGETWNSTAGCFHNCEWHTEGGISICYAKHTAEHSLAKRFYPHGFRHHYWHPARLLQPLKKKRSSGIFGGSMADIFGSWVPKEQIAAILDVVKRADWHIFQLLTKYPRALQKWNPFPSNAWVGMSLPAGNNPDPAAGARRFALDLRSLANVEADVRFISFEPLWFDPVPTLENYLEHHRDLPFEWAIIGATSMGRKIYQPETEHVSDLLNICDYYGIPVFFKGNLEWQPWRENFPLISHWHPRWLDYAKAAA